jgi:hypothetical protein
MAGSWSEVVTEQFQVKLPSDVTEWLDLEMWRRHEATPLGDSTSPHALLDTRSSVVWGGQMLPDTLPLFDNGCGDVWALRFGIDGSLSEIIFWNHEGGDWRPYGRTLAEAFLYSVAENWSRGDWDEEFRNQVETPLADWAVRRLFGETNPPSTFRERFAANGRSPVQNLLDAGLAEVPIRRDLCKQCLASGLVTASASIGGASITEALGVEWRKTQDWRIDTTFIPEEMRERLAGLLGISVPELMRQDWEGAAREAEQVLRLRKDLAWPYAVLGRAAERRGDTEQAVSFYMDSLQSIGSTQDFAEGWNWDGNRTWFTYPVRRLAQLEIGPEESSERGRYLQAAMKRELGTYWLEEGERAEREGRDGDAYHCYYYSGWDDFSAQDAALLERLVRRADAAGYAALREIANHHRLCLESSRGAPPARSGCNPMMRWVSGWLVS